MQRSVLVIFTAALVMMGAAANGAGVSAQAPAPAGDARPDATRLLEAQGRLGYGLIERLAPRAGSKANAGDDTNVMVSPASLAAVFAFLDLGASDAMRAAIHRTLGFGKASPERQAAALEDVRKAAAGRGGDTADGPLSLANSILFDPASAPREKALAALKAAGAHYAVEDLSRPETIARINEWVSGQTRGLIPTLLDEPLRKGGLVALNALHFKDRWRVPFDVKATRPVPFHPVSGKAFEVPMMRAQGARLRFRLNERFVAVDLPYASKDFSIVFATTRDRPAQAHEFAPVAGWLGGAGFMERQGEFALPRFSLAQSAELLKPLDGMGLGRARLAPDALAGFSPEPQIIARVMQKTVLRVNEEGTEAAAATAAATVRSMMQEFVKMTVDKPFLFALRDSQSGLILLMGYVGKPEADDGGRT